VRYRLGVFIYNPAARRVRRLAVDQVIAALARDVEKVETRATRGPASATELARQACAEGADIVIACGGDGTINEVINGIAPGNVPLAIVPAGTADVLATEIGLPRNSLRAAECLPQLEARRISLGLLRHAGPASESRYFVLMGGVGLDAKVVCAVNPRLKARIGELAYWLAGAAEIGSRLERFEVCIDGRRYECTFALASLARIYGGNLRIARRAHLLAGDLEMVLFHSRHSLRYLLYLSGVLSGRLHQFSDVTFVNAKRVEMQALVRPPVHVQVDGEYAGTLPAAFEIAEQSLTLLMPASYLTKYGGEEQAPAV